MEWGSYNRGHDMARQLRPFFHWSVPARKLSKWADEDHFVSWLRLCPDNRISGDKVIGKGRLPTNNRASIALRMAASTLRMSNTYLGAQFRRFRTKLGSPHCDQGHGRQAGALGLPHAALRDEVRRSGSAILRRPTPQATGYAARVESCQAGISGCRSSRSLKRRSFRGENRN
jgi:hypothetical protein